MINILIGPLKRDPDFKDILSSYEILGDYAAAPEILTFNELDLTSEDEINTSFKEVTESLPLNWKQDVVIFWGMDKSIVPDDLEDLDCPVIGVVFNWNMAFEAVKQNSSRFDWIFTDKKGEQILKQAGIKHVSSLLLRGFSPNLHEKLDEFEKEYDITFIGEIDHELHQERTKCLYRLAKLADKYNIKFASEIYGEDYVELINKSRIVFNHSTKGEANLRCFEIPACGSLLFVEESNAEAKSFLNDKEHCVYYNEDNFEDLLDYYLSKHDEREKISTQGQRKIQDYSFEKMFGRLIEAIEQLDFDKIKENRTFKKLAPVAQHRAKAKQSLQSFLPGKFYFVEKELQAAYQLSKNQPEIFNDLGVIYANAYFALTDKKDRRLFNRAHSSLQNALSFDPNYGLARYNLAVLYYLDEDYLKAEEFLSSFLMMVTTEPQEMIQRKGFYYIVPNISYHDDFKLAWEKASYESSYDEEDRNFAYCDLLINRTLTMLGDIAMHNHDYESAEEMYSNALRAKDNIGYVSYKLAKALTAQQKNQEALKYIEATLAAKPFYEENWLLKLEVLNKLDNLEEYENFSLELLTTTKVSPYYQRYKKKINRQLARII